MNKQNNFIALRKLQEDYKIYVMTFQKYRNPTIREWVKEKIEQRGLIQRIHNIHLFANKEMISDLGIITLSAVPEETLNNGVLHLFP